MMACNLSHSPLFGLNQPSSAVVDDVQLAIDAARERIARWRPDLVVIFAPDHYNGFFYDLMPQFCVGLQARSLGDWDGTAGELPVDSDAAEALLRALLDEGFDLASSRRMVVDHGFAQPLELLTGSLDALPIVPIFVNAASPPLASWLRVRELGSAVGRFLHGRSERTLLIGSGGLSHDPPIPSIVDASPDVAEGLIAGRDPSPQSVSARRQRVLTEARAVAEGTSSRAPLAPEWDRRVLGLLADGEFAQLETWTNDVVNEVAGNAAQEVRNWVAALAALAAGGPYTIEQRYYRTIPEWMCGYGLMVAVTA